MGAGRKKTTLPLIEKPETSRTVNCSPPARNLRKSDLAAVIFGCKHNTVSECYSELLFGLPSPHFSYVKNINPGLPLFLFNYSDRKLHGIFEATSHGQMNIDAYGWTVDGAEYTQYPAQVRVRILNQCQPLNEDQFRPVIKDNYYEHRLFWFELDRAQTRNLISLFSVSPVDAGVSLSRNIAKCNTLAKSLPTFDRGQILHGAEAPFSEAVSAHSNEFDLQWGNSSTDSSVMARTNTSYQQKTWSSLFKNPASQTLEEHEDLEARGPDVNFPGVDQHNMEWDSLPVPSWLKSEVLNHEALPKDSAMWNCEVVPADPDSGKELPCSVLQRISCEALDVYTKQEDELVTSYENIPPSDDSNMFCRSSCATPHLDGESQPSEAFTDDDVAKVYEENVQGKGYSHPLSTDELNSEDECSSEALEVVETKSSSIESIVAKMMQEIGGLKVSQLKQVQKISSLEQELVESKVEIQQLKNRCHALEYGPSSSIARIHGSILMVGGFDGCSWLSALDSYFPSEDTMKSLKPMTFARSYASQATLNGEIYVFGGVHGDAWHDTVESYNPTSDQWVSRPSLNQKKGSLAGALLCDKIFAVGGGNGVECYSEVEMLDMNVGRWITTRSMLQKRFAPAAAEINGTLYVVGGYDGRNYLDSVERFDSREHSWTRLRNMNTRRGCHSLVVLNEKLYALGGYNGAEMTSTVEIFDPRHGSWMMGDPMNNGRGYFGAVVLREKLYVIGGVKENDFILDSIECYKDGCSWEVTDLKAVGKRCFFSATVF